MRRAVGCRTGLKSLPLVLAEEAGAKPKPIDARSIHLSSKVVSAVLGICFRVDVHSSLNFSDQFATSFRKPGCFLTSRYLAHPQYMRAHTAGTCWER